MKPADKNFFVLGLINSLKSDPGSQEGHGIA